MQGTGGGNSTTFRGTLPGFKFQLSLWDVACFSTSLSLSLLLSCKMGTNFAFSEEVLRTSNNVSH